ncbi:hypothetical protein JQX13_42265 [Archangium violaceum]|uniref:hypothetical protein n=1 Tax=Archangium violaceum TaxID=83451 RepID=UPI00193B8192|nr:hypothetical protein [Archangium violaceum]QRK06640.1 hypothetical protein JQX13_42265 [Archangium violaceum]
MGTATASSGSGTHSQMGTWSWGQRALARIAELKALCEDSKAHKDAAPNAQTLAREANDRLDAACRAADQRRFPWGRSGALIDTVETNIHAAYCLMLRYMPLADLEARIPELIATLREHLPARDPRRLAVEGLVKSSVTPKLAEANRETVITALQAALLAQEREYVRVRSFRNIVYGISLCLMVLAVTLGVVMAMSPNLMPLCFQPEGRVVCPTASGTEGANPYGLTSSLDYLLVELIGLISAALAAAVSLRQLRGTVIPHSVPLALALLKLPTGALTAVLGLLLMRGEFVPGLSNLDSSAQIIAWAVIFGYAQQLFTRLVDERGQAILNAVGGAESATLMDQRISSVSGPKTQAPAAEPAAPVASPMAPAANP